jgi:FHA domain-containing protein
LEPRTSGAVLRNTFPDELKEAATGSERHQFLTLYSETLILLVRLGAESDDLATGLRVTAVREEANVPVAPVPGSMWSRTHTDRALDTMGAYGKSLGLEAELELAKVLAGERHFGVPLRKRITAEALSPHQITFGRAANKDIVLRHSSVSKSHGWFEADEDGVFYVADADSTNSTRINGRHIGNVPTPIKPGDVLRFGLVEAVVCAPRALWTVLSRAAARAA